MKGWSSYLLADWHVVFYRPVKKYVHVIVIFYDGLEAWYYFSSRASPQSLKILRNTHVYVSLVMKFLMHSGGNLHWYVQMYKGVNVPNQSVKWLGTWWRTLNINKFTCIDEKKYSGSGTLICCSYAACYFCRVNTRRERTGNLRLIQKPPLEWPACRGFLTTIIMYINNLLSAL